MINKHDGSLNTSDSRNEVLSLLREGRAGRVMRRGAVLLASVLAAAVALGVAGSASAAYGTCQPRAIWEDGLRNFQVKCNPGGAAEMLVFTTTNDAQATRFQSLISSAILAGKYVRGDFVAETTLCAGFSNCKRAATWSLSDVANP